MLDAFPDLDGLDGLGDFQANADFDQMPDFADQSFDFDDDGMNDLYDSMIDCDGDGLVNNADPMVADYVQSLSMPDPFGGPEDGIDHLHADADVDGMPDTADRSFDFDSDGMNDIIDSRVDMDGDGLVNKADPMAAGYVESVSMPDASSSVMTDAGMAVPQAGASGTV